MYAIHLIIIKNVWLTTVVKKARVWTFPLLLVYVVLLHYLFLLCKMTTRPIWLGTQGETGVDAGPALLSLVRVSAGWCSFLSPASQAVCKPIFIWKHLHAALKQMHFSIELWQGRLVIVLLKWFLFKKDNAHSVKSCWELGRGTQIEWPGCILICGAVLFLGLMGVCLVWSGLSLLHQILPFRVSLCPLYYQTCMCDNL